MRGGSQPDRILALLADRPGLDDDEIASALGIAPRQTVNQICRRLADQGVILRERGPRGKIVNLLSGKARPKQAPAVLPQLETIRTVQAAETIRTFGGEMLAPADLASTLIVLPCSGAKKAYPETRGEADTIIDHLPEDLAAELAAARRSVKARIPFDESMLVPAWQRYDGTLYRAGRPALVALREAGAHVLILSGGYGLVTADEPIGDYDTILKPGWWPRNLLPQALIAYAEGSGIRSVRAFAAETSSYRKVLGRVAWRAAGIEDALLIMPEAEPGAMVRAPGTMGEALAALHAGTLTTSWRSSYGLRITVLQS
jgi:biotin operon repressor